MRKIFSIALLTVAGLSQAIVIDDFNSGAVTSVINGGSVSSYTASGVLGGFRYINQNVVSNFGLSHTSAVTSGANGYYVSSAKTGVDANEKIGYGLDVTGNNSVGTDLNLNLSSLSAFTFQVLENDLSTDFKIGIFSRTSGLTTFSNIHTVGSVVWGSPTTVTVNFSEFSNPVDFADVDAISFYVDGVLDDDVVLDNFEAVPEPATMTLLVAGVAALAARRKKANR